MKRGFLLGKKVTPAAPAAPAQPAPPPPSTASSPMSPLPLASTASFPTTPADSSTLHWTFHPSSTAADLALHATGQTLAALRSTPCFSSPSPPPLPSLPPIYEIREVPGKGKGLISTTDLPADTLVLLDRPLLVWQPGALPRPHLNALLSHALSRLKPEKQEEFLALSNCFPTSSDSALLGRAETNGLPVVHLADLPPSSQADEVTYTGVFPLASRLNHSCDANCRLEFSAREWRLAVRTNRAVKRGDELCISYIVPFQTRDMRRAELKLKYRFLCQCAWCSLPDDLSAKKDEERERMAKEFLRQWDAQQMGER
ncbi:hypothetical protein JCM8097_001052 [Rhodosporidiobolus ruineniae]